MNPARLDQMYKMISYYCHMSNVATIPTEVVRILTRMCATIGTFKEDQEGIYWYDYGSEK